MNSSPPVDLIPFPSLEQEDERAIVMAAITTTLTQFQSPTSASTISASSSPFLSSIRYYTTTITASATSTTYSSSQATPVEPFSFDNASLWHQLFPALIVFAIIGALATLLILILLFFCLYRRQRQRRRSLQDTSDRPPLFGHTEKVQTPTSMTTTLQHLGVPETSNDPALSYQQQRYSTAMYPRSTPTLPQQPRPYHYFSTTTPQPTVSSLSPVSSTFVPIETSPLTLVPRAAIWKDPQRRRGVNELDLWEQKQQQRFTQPHITYDNIQSTASFHPTFKDDSSTTADDGHDRQWQRYVQSFVRSTDLENEEDQHSLHSSSTILHPDPIYNLNQEMDDLSIVEVRKNEDTPHGCLESSGSSQWLCPPSTLKP